MRMDMGMVLCALMAAPAGGCETRGVQEEKNTREEEVISGKEQVVLQRCIREHLPTKDPSAAEWVVSGSAFASAFEACSQKPADERPALFRTVADAMARPDGDLTQLIIEPP